jgi:hypothetical protein
MYAQLVVSKWHSGPGPLNIGKTAASTSGRAGGILKRGHIKNSAGATMLKRKRVHFSSGECCVLAQIGCSVAQLWVRRSPDRVRRSLDRVQRS